MNRAQKIFVGFFIVSIIVIAVLYAVYYQVNSTENIFNTLSNKTVLYYSTTCPHCKIVEEFIKNNNIGSKINITQKEIYSNPLNANELIKVGEACKLNQDYIGAVPLLYFNKKCYVGDKEITSFLAKQLNLSVSP